MPVTFAPYLSAANLAKLPQPAPYVKAPTTLFQPYLPADRVGLPLLRLVKAVRLLPVTAGIDHPPVQHPLKEVIAEVVMALAYLERPAFLAPVKEQRGNRIDEDLPILKLLLRACGHEPVEALVYPVAFPPLIHVCLAKSQAAVTHHPWIEILIPDPDVPWPGPVYPDVSRREDPFDKTL